MTIESLHIRQGIEAPMEYVTISCGVAVITPGEDDHKQDLITAADAALYKSKSNQRNCVSTA